MGIENAIRVNGNKFFSIENGGFWSDPLHQQAIQTTTIIPETKEVIQFDTEGEMITEIKKSKYKFKASHLSHETKVKFIDEGKAFEDDQGEGEQ